MLLCLCNTTPPTPTPTHTKTPKNKSSGIWDFNLFNLDYHNHKIHQLNQAHKQRTYWGSGCSLPRGREEQQNNIVKHPVALRVLFGIFNLTWEMGSAPRMPESPRTAAAHKLLLHTAPGEAYMHLTALFNKNCAVRVEKEKKGWT